MTGTHGGPAGTETRNGAADVAAMVRSVNGLTARWARRTVRDAEGTVFTAAGVWPLLASLAAGAEGPARGELLAALETGGQVRAADAARELFALLRDMPGVRAALGLWTHRQVELDPDWAGALPDGSRGELVGDPEADRGRLDAWARERTEGAIPVMPVRLEAETVLVLASALTVRTTWAREFTPGWGGMTPEHGPWAGRRLATLHRWERGDEALVGIAVADTPAGAVTRLRVAGDASVDVHLLLGAEGMEAGAVLGAGATMPQEAAWIVPGGRLPYGEPGPGVAVGEVQSWDDQPSLAVTAVPFTVSASHDLLAQADIFGLATACDASAPKGHFPGISRSVPLVVGSALQDTTASFSAKGFFAAAVTAASVAAGGIPQQRAKSVHVRFDRPFGFLAVHRGTGLVLVGGWVTEPEKEPEQQAGAPRWA